MASRKVSREGPPSRRNSRQQSRFHVNKVDGLGDIQSGSGGSDDDNQFTYVNDTQFPKSFGQLTREALPKADNYRHVGSIHAKPRPTLEELRNGTYIAKIPPSDEKGAPGDVEEQKGKVVKFTWLEGVLMRCLLNIWGVMLFLRMSWCIGQAGLMEGLLLITLANIVTFITALSMSAVSTNGQISGGGIYYMISRSLGPEFGAAIGLMFTIANSVAVSLHTIGFCESLNDLLKQYFDIEFLGGNDDLNSVRVIGAITLVCILILAFVGMDWVTRAQMLFLVILVAAQVDFIVGSIMGPGDDDERKAQGFIGYNSKTFKTNFWSDYRTGIGSDVQQNFFTVFGVFFPSVTGIVAGANLSGDLKDPAGAIPKGTLLAITITYISYVLYSTMMSACALREATGNVTQYLDPSGGWTYDNCVDQVCDYGLLNSFQVMELISAWGPLIYMGCFAATLSSAIASLVGAPRVLQALAKDRLYPFIHFFAKGHGANNDPIRGYLLVFGLSLGCVAIAKLNSIAPIQSNFFLMAYCLINFSCFHATVTKSPGWRPAFKYFNAWVSLLGSLMCVVVMFLMSWVMALATIAVVTFLYLYLTYTKPDVNWGSSTQAQSYNSALKSVQNLNEVAEHVKNYRPQLLVLSGGMGTRPVLIDFAYLITKNISLMVCGHVATEEYNQKMRNALNNQANHWLRSHQRKAFYSLVEAEKFDGGCRSMMQNVGLGKLKPNMVLMGYKGDWGKVGAQKLQEYFGVINHALGLHLSVGILRVQGGLDYSGVVEEEGEANPETLMEELKKRREVSRANSMIKKKTQPPQELEEEAGISSDGGDDSPPEVRKLSNNLKAGDDKQDVRSRKISHYVMPGTGAELPQTILEDVTRFTRKQKKGTIDVWWLYDDGGLTLLVPYILSTHYLFKGSSLRVFIVSSKIGDELEMEKITMASLLSKFRIDFSAVVVIGDIQRKAEEKTKKEFDDLTEPFISMQESPDGSSISRSEFMANRERTNRYLRLGEELQKHSSEANIVVMTLPIPRKGTVSPPLYMAWLEMMSKKMPPFLFLRGNQTSVLTFYS